MADETSGQTPASFEDKDKAIQKLTDEKKALEGKNKRLASILEITAKNVSKLKAQEAADAQKGEEAGGEIASQVISIKKEIGSLERKIEKSKSLQSSEQLNAVLAEFKTGLSKVDERLNALDKITVVEKRLGDIEDSITLRKRSKGNLFGGLGTIGGGGNPEETGNEEGNYNSPDDFGKLDEINLKLDAITKKMEIAHIGLEKHSFSEDLKKIIPVLSGKGRGKDTGDSVGMQQDENEPGDSKSAAVSGITFKKIEPLQTQKEERHCDISSNSPIGLGWKASSERKRNEMKTLNPRLSGDEEQGYVSLQPSDNNENPGDLAGGGIDFKVHTPAHFMDFKKIPEDIRSGHVVLLNVKTLKEESTDELRHFIERIKRVSDGISSKIVGIGEHHIMILPKKISLHHDSDKS
ncbi:Cell division protein SepF [uncultured archaeon]|nr:Cell division protein SepF [uncultured archaeon]